MLDCACHQLLNRIQCEGWSSEMHELLDDWSKSLVEVNACLSRLNLLRGWKSIYWSGLMHVS